MIRAVAMTAIHDEDWQAVAREDWGGASEEDPVTSIKLVHDGEARRFGVALVFFDGDAGPATRDYEFAALRAHVEDTFPSAPTNARLTYVDDEGDVITVDSNSELATAFAVARAGGRRAVRFDVDARAPTKARDEGGRQQPEPATEAALLRRAYETEAASLRREYEVRARSCAAAVAAPAYRCGVN